MDIIARIASLADAQVLSVIQAASEMPDTYSVERKLEAGFEERVG